MGMIFCLIIEIGLIMSKVETWKMQQYQQSSRVANREEFRNEYLLTILLRFVLAPIIGVENLISPFE